MSFSSEVKNELFDRSGQARHCRLSEMKAIYDAAGCACSGPAGTETESGKAVGAVVFGRKDSVACRKFGALLAQTYKTETDCRGGAVFGDEKILRDAVSAVGSQVVKSSCCRRAYLRGAFLCAGTVTDPAKAYQLEYTLKNRGLAREILGMLREEGVSAKLTERNKRYVVYLRGGEEIVKLLGMMEAGRALLVMENERVTRDVRGNINRRVNLEAANIGKAAAVAAEQIEVIKRLSENGGLERLSPSLREIARARLDHPDATYEELGEMLSVPLGKSGVNHRLRRLMETASAVPEED